MTDHKQSIEQEADWHEIAENFVMDVTNDNMVFSSPRYVTNKLTELLSKLSPAPQNAAGDNWISVGKGKPEQCVKVICKRWRHGHSGDVVFGYYEYENGKDVWYDDYEHDIHGDANGNYVTHWMPISVLDKLPSPPSATAEQDKK